MQTKEDIEKWKEFLPLVAEFARDGGRCLSTPCFKCPFSGYHIGYSITCVGFGLRGEGARGAVDPKLLESCEKYLRGDILFLNGKLVEVED